MQYILTEYEYDSLKARQRYNIKILKQELQSLCVEIAEGLPVVMSARDSTLGIHGCIFSKIHKANYCDDCSVKSICPNEDKLLSK